MPWRRMEPADGEVEVQVTMTGLSWLGRPTTMSPGDVGNLTHRKNVSATRRARDPRRTVGYNRGEGAGPAARPSFSPTSSRRESSR